MTRVAAVDCGTNSLRLLVADVTAAGPGQGDRPVKTDVHREMRIVRLGQGVDRTGELAPEALERVHAALVDYAATCRELRVEAVRMVATSATRDARNRDAFSSLVHEALGVLPEVVSGAQEAELSFDGATRGLDPSLGPFLVVDIGGGSTEVVLGELTADGVGRVEAALSVDVGCVRLHERHLHDDPPTAEQVEAARTDVRAALDRVRATVPVGRARTAIGLAGTVTTVAALALDLPAYDAQRTHGARLAAADVRRVGDTLLALSSQQRRALPVVHPGRADVIGAGALVLQTVVDGLDLAEVLVSEADILDGIAWSVPPWTSTGTGVA